MIITIKLIKNILLKKYVQNTGWLFFEQIIRLLIGLIVNIWVIRYLGPEKFGILSYVIAFVSFFSIFAKLGLDSIVVRNIVLFPEKRTEYLGTAFLLKFAGAIFAITAILISLIFLRNSFQENLFIIIVAMGMVFQIFEVIDFHFQSLVLSKYSVFSKLPIATIIIKRFS